MRDLERAASELASHLEDTRDVEEPQVPDDDVELPTARGHRQQQILSMLQESNPDEGLTTRHISTETGMDQSNVYLALQALRSQDKVEMISGSEPQRWRLAPRFWGWQKVRQVASVVPEGWWTTYGDIADVVYGNTRAAVTVGQAATRLSNFPNPHRVLGSRGRVPAGWRDSDGNGAEECVRRLKAEGVSFDDDVADRARYLSFDDLRELLG
jgi:alkylated DNA nucleotide flippase Atl1